jgi:hypothetical protein
MVAKSNFKMPRNAMYVDEIGLLNEQIDELEARRDKLIGRINKKIGLISGHEFQATVFEKKNAWLNGPKIKRLLGEDTFAKCWKRNTSVCVRVTKL